MNDTDNNHHNIIICDDINSIICNTVVYPTNENKFTAFVDVIMSKEGCKFKYTGHASMSTANSDNPQTIIDTAINNAISRVSMLAMNLSNLSSSNSKSYSEWSDHAVANEDLSKTSANAPSSNDRPQNRHSKSKPISDGQKSFLHKLAREKASNADSLAREKFGASVDDLSSWQCQEILNDLKYGS